MPLLLPADIAAPPVAFVAGIGVVVLLIPIVVVEAIVMRLLHWSSVLWSLLAATVMNIASALVGGVLLGLAINSPAADLKRLLLVILPIAWVLSVLIEGGVMWLFQRLPVRRTLGVSALANAVSYALLIGLVVYASLR